MNYQKHYDLLIGRARNRVLSEGYIERHHIVPKCMGGANSVENLVALTPEEHFVAHVLLVKIHPEHDGLICAVNKMCRGLKGRRKRKLYGWLKRRFSEAQSRRQTGSGNSQFGTRWINDGVKSSKLKNDTPLPLGYFEGRVSKSYKVFCRDCGGVTVSDERCRAIYCNDCRKNHFCTDHSFILNHHYMKHRTEEQEAKRRSKISETMTRKRAPVANIGKAGAL